MMVATEREKERESESERGNISSHSDYHDESTCLSLKKIITKQELGYYTNKHRPWTKLHSSQSLRPEASFYL